MTTSASDLRARAILSRLGANPRGVEVGVYRGALSRRLLVRRDLHLMMVDKWGDHTRAYAASGDLLATHDETEWHNIREAADVHTRWADDRRTVVQSDSVAAAQDCPDASLDFVFIDADHSYEGAFADILAWVGKVRAGGLLGGHDYHAPDYPLWGVKRAVDEFAADRSLTVELGDDDTWFIRLPGPLPGASAEYDQIIVCCVKWGTKYGPEYVNILADMVARNCELPYQFWCFTDDPRGLAEDVQPRNLPPGLDGWWNKLALFKPGTFPPNTRVLFLDLDVIVCGPIEPLINMTGIAADWLQGGYNSSVMVWDAGEYHDVWEKYDAGVPDVFHGDQDWLTLRGGWKYLPPDWIVSYRLHATEWPPKGAIVVAFHGEPKPHEITAGWVPEMWTMAGLAIPRYTSVLNNDITTIRANVAANKRADVPSVTVANAHGRPLIICAGGPSLADNLPAIQLERTRTGADLWALNGAHDYLIDRGIVPSAMVMLDSRLACVDAFLRYPLSSCEYLIATQCDPFAFERLAYYRLKRWTGWYWGVEDELVIGGGATVGLKSIMLAAAMGYRRFSLYGYDSSYRDGADHAYPQALNANDLRVDIVLYGRKFVAARWMAKQVVEFLQMAHDLTASFGCEFNVHGDGLLPYAASVASKERMAA